VVVEVCPKIKGRHALSTFSQLSKRGFGDVYDGRIQIFNMTGGRWRELQSPEAQSLPARRLTTMKPLNPKQGRYGIVAVTSEEKALSLPLESKAVTQ